MISWSGAGFRFRIFQILQHSFCYSPQRSWGISFDLTVEIMVVVTIIAVAMPAIMAMPVVMLETMMIIIVIIFMMVIEGMVSMEFMVMIGIRGFPFKQKVWPPIRSHHCRIIGYSLIF